MTRDQDKLDKSAVPTPTPAPAAAPVSAAAMPLAGTNIAADRNQPLTPQQTSDGQLAVGDRVQVECEVAAIGAGDFLTLKVLRGPATGGVAPATIDSGVTLTVAANQARKL